MDLEIECRVQSNYLLHNNNGSARAELLLLIFGIFSVQVYEVAVDVVVYQLIIYQYLKVKENEC